MTDKLDKKQIEAVLGEKIGDDALQLINFWMRVAISTRTDGITTSRNMLIATPNFCSQNYVKDVSGWTTTGPNGQSVFKLSSFICSNGELYNYPINVIATPVSTKPLFLTVTHSLVNSAKDVEIKVFAWDANGAPAPNITFNWRCRVELPLIP